MPSQDYGAEKQASNVTTRHIEKEGFTLLASGGDKPLFDIVFVHGLQGDPEETWTHSEIVKEEDPSIQQDENGQRSIWEKGLSLFRQGNPVATKRMRTFWPRDILPYDFPNARILSYGYASKVSYFFGSDKPSHENLTENGRNLMNGLAAHRAEAIGRPLMLITHSLGGLVVKSALRLSAEHDDGDKDLRDIYDSTFAAIFFGTPHRGSDWVGLGKFLEKAASALGFSTNDYNLKALQANSEILLILRESFAKMLDREAFFITSFQESRTFKPIKGLDAKIVENDSSGLDHKHERKQGLNSDHIGMCKFAKSGRSYIEYRDKVQREIQRHAKRMSDTSIEQQQSCLEALRNVAVTNIREAQVEPAHFQTLHWLLRTGTGPDSPRLLEWCGKQWGVFWIQGRPASGKSTAMKFLLHHPRVKESLDVQAGDVRWKLAGIFFTDRLGQMERSWKAVLASMLYQLVSEVTSLKDILVPLSKRRERKKFVMPELEKEITTPETLYDWDIPSLQNALLFFKNQRSIHFKICYFIDALDENNEEEYSRRSVTEFLLKLASASTDVGYGVFKICTASRPENDLSELLSSYNSFKIHEWTRPDIETYVRDELGQHPPMRPLVLSSNDSIRKRANGLMSQIVEKAQGVFLWVRLIVGDLRDSLTNGLASNIDDLEGILGQTPERLQEFYALILKRIPSKYRSDSLAIFECVLQAQEPLTLLDLWLILESRKQSDSNNSSKSFISFSDEQLSSILASGPGLERRIKSCSGGLLEVRYNGASPPKRHSWSLRQGSNDSSPGRCSNQELLEKELLTKSKDRSCLDDGAERQDHSMLDREIQEVDIVWCTVQVLHQTVRELLSKPANLLSDQQQERSTSMDTVENADLIFLRTFLFWLRVPKAQQLSLYPGTNVYVQEYFFQHAKKADELQSHCSVGILDEIDEVARLKYDTSSWPQEIEIWEVRRKRFSVDLLTYAVYIGLSHYVEQKLEEESKIILQDAGRNLLRFVVVLHENPVFSGSPKVDIKMLKILLRFGANVEDVNEKRSAIELLLFSSLVSEVVWSQALVLEGMLLLLQHGANPDQIVMDTPCLFASLMYVPNEREAFPMIKSLVEYGANLEVVDERGERFIDVAFETRFDPTTVEWIWLFNHGLRIHASSIAELYSERSEYHTLRTESCRNSEYYTPAARLKARKFNPQWSFAEKYLPVRSRPGSSKASSPSRKSRRL